MTNFEALGLSPRLLKTINKLGFDTPTPIQTEAIPLVLEGNDLIGLAQTGTGKTAAFGLPIVDQLLAADHRPSPKSVHALILAPTRELANQISTNVRSFVNKTPLRVNSVVGGMSINNQVRNLKQGTDILIATPGRLLDLVDRKAVRLDTARFLVLDEADQMLDLGFIHDLRTISKLLNKERQTLLFSATMARQVEGLSRAYLTNPVRVETSPVGRAADKIKQTVCFTPQANKVDLLKTRLRERPEDLSLIFMRTKHGAEKLMKQLNAADFSAGSIHGNKNQNQRERALKAFRAGRTRILVATDVAARGIDIPDVSHVYNYEFPEAPENYVHRIGRTARAGKSGEAVAFCAPEEYWMLLAIQKLMSAEIEVASGELSDDEKRRFSRKPKGGMRPKGRGPAPQRGPKKARGGGRKEGAGARHSRADGNLDGKPAREGKPARQTRAQETDGAREHETQSRSHTPGKKPFAKKTREHGKKRPFNADGKPAGKSGGRPGRPYRDSADGRNDGRREGRGDERRDGRRDGRSDSRSEGRGDRKPHHGNRHRGDGKKYEPTLEHLHSEGGDGAQSDRPRRSSKGGYRASNDNDQSRYGEGRPARQKTNGAKKKFGAKAGGFKSGGPKSGGSKSGFEGKSGKPKTGGKPGASTRTAGEGKAGNSGKPKRNGGKFQGAKFQGKGAPKNSTRSGQSKGGQSEGGAKPPRNRKRTKPKRDAA